MSDTADPPTILTATIVIEGRKFAISDMKMVTEEEHLINETERKMLGMSEPHELEQLEALHGEQSYTQPTPRRSRWEHSRICSAVHSSGCW